MKNMKYLDNYEIHARMKFHYFVVATAIVAFIIGSLTLFPLNSAILEQTDGITYYNVSKFSINTEGSGYGSGGTGTPVQMTDHTGFVHLELPAGAIQNSASTDDGIWLDLGGLLTTSTLTAAGSDTQVQFNDGGVLGADAEFTWNKTTNVMTISSGGASISIDGINDTITSSSGTIGFGDELLTTTGTITAGGITYPAAVPGSNNYLCIFDTDGSTELIAQSSLGFTLDNAYDAGNTIDYSSGNGPVELLFPDNGTTDTHNGQEVMNFFMDTDEVDTASAVMVQMHWDVDTTPSVAKFMSFWHLNGTPAEVLFFSSGGNIFSAGVITAESSFSAGDVNSEGNVVYHDGDGESITWFADDIITSITLDQDNLGAWTDDYLFSLNDLTGNNWELVAVDPDSVGTDALVGIDSGATPGYIGNAAGDGVLRVNVTNGLTWTDGGDFATIAFDADYGDISGNDGATGVTGAELETLSDGSNADSLHVHITDNVIIDSIPDVDDTAEGIKSVLTAGENVVFVNVLYQNADGEMYLADADGAGTYPAMAMALESKADGQAVSVITYGYVRDETWTWTVGGIIYLSDTAGGLTQIAPSTTGDQVQVMGIATHADRMFFNPNLMLIEIN